MSDELVSRLRDELARTHAELRAARSRMLAMEASSFWKLRNAWWRVKTRLTGRPEPGLAAPLPEERAAAPAPEALPRARETFVTVAVRFAPGDGDPRPLLDAILSSTSGPYALLLVDDGTDGETRTLLADLAATLDARLVRHDVPLGFAASANAALDAAKDGVVALLGPGALPTPGWLDRMAAALEERPEAAAVIPLPAGPSGGLSPERFAMLLAAEPPVRPVDERLSPAPGLLLRPGGLRFDPALADPAPALAAFGEVLRQRNRVTVVADDVFLGGSAEAPAVAQDRVLSARRRRAARLASIDARRRAVRERLEGRRVLFVLPVMERGGGANIVFTEALEMVRMGVDARVLNLTSFRPTFEGHYPDPEVPVLWADPHEIAEASRGFDAVVATANTSVEWLRPLARFSRRPVIGYYVQDFEPLFYPEGSRGHRQAFDSYTLIPDMVLVTKTDWNRREVEEKTGARARVVGPSYDAATFRPTGPEPPSSPVRLAAMIRPSSARRQPGLTMDVLEKVQARFGDRVAITTFGEDRAHPDWPPLERTFAHESLGVADGTRLATLFGGVHAFVDLSTYQAMGLSALEAMACGATAILPLAGGGTSFATDGEDALFVDTRREEECLAAIGRLVESPELRARLAARATLAAERFHPAFAAANVLEALFGDA